jgi:5-methyltetrahydropteroyltriglutamate--homocysteine methyltransferase
MDRPASDMALERSAGGLLTSTAGSYARPSWLFAGLTAAERGELGAADVAELLDDAVDLALREQETAGIDVLTDGEMRRAGFFTAAFYGHLTGLRPLAPGRLVGPTGHDQQHRFEVLEPITAPTGLGVVAEYMYARAHTRRPLKMTIPGPFTLSGRLTHGPGQVYPDRLAAAWAFVPILNAELLALAAAGATFVQVDEPSPAIHPEAEADFAGLMNAALDGVTGMRVAVHLCFGNYMGRPLAKRTYRPSLSTMLAYRADELLLEFANRELTELDVLTDLASQRDLAVGVIDVKSYYLETAADVAERIERVLAAGVPADRLTLVPDCGFSQTARWAARAKLAALVAGTRLVLDRR